MVHSSSSSGIFFQEDAQQSQPPRNHHLSSYGSSANLIPGNMYSNMIPVSSNINNTGIDSRASSLLTDDNSGLSGGTPRLQKSASINTESYMRLPASPLSFSSNNISISGSSVLDAPSPMHQSSNQDQGPRQGASTATSLPRPNGPMVLGGFSLDHDSITHLQKRPRFDIKQEDVTQQQVLRQILQRQDSMQLQALYQQQQRQLLQSLPPVQRTHLLQQQQLQMRQKLQEQGLQPASTITRPYDGGVCSRRLMQYLYHQRQQPADISYWRKFVAEYYSPRAKKRWCLSLCNNVGQHSLGVFSPSTMDAWQCGVCGSKSGRGFEATFEILPRLNEIKFSSGVIEELWFLDLPQESRFPSGIMILEYEKAVQESVYENLRVVHEGQLKVIFTPDLKILTWDFCARKHEELLPRRLVAPQVNQFLQVAHKCQSTIAESGSNRVSQQDLQINSNMVVTAGRQLARSLELQSLNDLGFSKRYVRCLQTSEVVNSMKDLMDFCRETKAGPLEALKNFSRHKRQMSSIQGHPTDRNVTGAPFGSLSNYQNMLMRQNLMNSNSQTNNNNNMAASAGFSNMPPAYQRFSAGVMQVQQNHRHQSLAHGGGPAVHHHATQPIPAVFGRSGGGGLTGSNSDLPNVSDVFEDIGSELTENGFFNDEGEDGVGYGWKV